MVILVSEDIKNMFKYDFVIDKAMHKTNRHLNL